MPLMPQSHEEQIGLRKQRKQQYDSYRREDDGFYESARWKAIRQTVLTAEPICRSCKATAATEVDHQIPRRERPDLAYDAENLQPLCSQCHSRKTLDETKAKYKGVGKEVRIYRGMGG